MQKEIYWVYTYTGFLARDMDLLCIWCEDALWSVQQLVVLNLKMKSGMSVCASSSGVVSPHLLSSGSNDAQSLAQRLPECHRSTHGHLCAEVVKYNGKLTPYTLEPLNDVEAS